MHAPEPRAPSSAPAGASPGGAVSDGRHRVVLDALGGGFSAVGPVLLSPLGGDRPGPTNGLRVHLRDRGGGRWWTLGRSPGHPAPRDSPPVLRSEPGVLTLEQRAGELSASMRVWVDPSRSLELRRLTVRNHAGGSRAIELTTFVETVLHHAAHHAAHPLFSKLFLQTEWVERSPSGSSSGVLLVRRRPREASQHFPVLAHALLGADVIEYESDRAAFLGRGRPADSPWALASPEPLSGTVGNVLDPALSLRAVLELQPGEEKSVLLTLGASESSGELLQNLDDLADVELQRQSEAAATAQERTRRREIGLDDRRAQRLQEIHVSLLAGQPALRGRRAVLERAGGPVDGLRRWGIGGGVPFVLVSADDGGDGPGTESAVQAQRYWRALGLESEMVVLTSTPVPAELATAAGEGIGVHAIEAATLTSADRDRLEALAAWVHSERELPRCPTAMGSIPPAAEAERDRRGESGTEESPPLRFPIEHGGFAEDGREYVLRLRRREDGSWTRPPRPWVNLLANERFGLICSESGACSPFGGNSRERRIGPWSNDAVLDPHASAVFLRDEDEGDFWSPLPGPTPAGNFYEMRHGFGYSRCLHRSHGLLQETVIFVDRHHPLRRLRLRLRNETQRSRRLSIFDYQQLVLGPDDARSPRTVVTRIDTERRMLTATNPLAGWTGVCFATASADRPLTGWRASGDRGHFLGPGGSLAAPRVLLEGQDLEGGSGAGLDPCFAQQLGIEVPPATTVELSLVLGTADGVDQARGVARSQGRNGRTAEALDEVVEFWRERLSRVHISTPSPGLDLMVNGWLTYQTVVCRLWARSAFYQSGGAFGFRDQLQDALALVGLWPELGREQILLHASHQFVEGDVLHWWHPPDDRGIRTRFADDLLWLPHLTAHYLRVTGDRDLLDEQCPFLRAPRLEDGEAERFVQAQPSGERASLYEHGCRAIDRSLALGAHGLPLFGCGDWNDGMNRVGADGRGESVWMGFFLHTILGEWGPLCEERGDAERVERYQSHRAALGDAMEEAGWDGHWYRRGYYDDGCPLGSVESDECRIDALVQAWSVLSRAAPPRRAREAMRSVAEHLVDEEAGLIRLLTPPFVDTSHDPGYIKGYVAGVRENGGQYTHAALWVIQAFAELGERDRALRLLENVCPVYRTRDDAQVRRYQVEPYVVAADVYGVPPHVGRGGWTWYTGSAGWMLRVTLETVLGIRVQEGRWLVVDPRVPDHWEGFRVTWRPLGESSTYEVEVRNPDGCAEGVVDLRVDGRSLQLVDGQARVPLERDGRTHRVEVVLGRAESPAIATQAGSETA